MTLKPESYSCMKALSPGSTQGAVLTFHSYPEQRRADKGCSGGKLKTQDGGCPLLASSSAVPEVFLRVSFSLTLSLPSPSLRAPMRHRGPECPMCPLGPLGTSGSFSFIHGHIWLWLLLIHSWAHSGCCSVCRDGFQVTLSSWFHLRPIT